MGDLDRTLEDCYRVPRMNILAEGETIDMGNGTENDDPIPAHLRKPSEAELRKRFFYHPPRDAVAVSAHEAVSELTYGLAIELVKVCPQGRNLSLALTALEDVRMRANAAIAVDDPRP